MPEVEEGKAYCDKCQTSFPAEELFKHMIQHNEEEENNSSEKL